MKNRLLTLAGTLALLAVLGKFYAVPVLAQVRAALVKNIDERGRNPYTQQVVCDTTGSTLCSAVFPAVPVNKRLVIEHVSAAISTSAGLTSVRFFGNGTYQYILFQLQGLDFTGFNFYVANQPLLSYWEAGQSPSYSVMILPSGFEYISTVMTITGYLVDLTQ